MRLVWCKNCILIVCLGVQANLNLQNFEEALRDFKAVLEVDPENKAAKNQIVITNHKIKQIRDREKQTYAGMFQKFAERDAKVVIFYNVICIYCMSVTVACVNFNMIWLLNL